MGLLLLTTTTTTTATTNTNTTTTIIFILFPYLSYAMIAYKNAGCKLSFVKYFKNHVNIIFYQKKYFFWLMLV